MPHDEYTALAARSAAYRKAGWWRQEFLDDLVLRGRPSTSTTLTAGPLEMTRNELDEAVIKCAATLRGIGIRIGETAVVQLPNSIGLFVLVLGLIRVGARPVLTLPALREHELDPVFFAAKPTLVAVPAAQRRFDQLSMARGLKKRHPSVRTLVVADGGGERQGEVALDSLWADPVEDSTEEVENRSPSDVALYLLSSGTTGAPKLIPRTHEAFGHVIREAARVSALDETSVYLAALPATHSFAFGHPGVLGTLASGGRAVLAGPENPAAALQIVATERVTHCALSPALLLQWLQVAERGEYDTSSLRVLQVGGARLDEATARRAEAVLGGRVQQVYGMSEGLLNFTRVEDSPDVIFGTQGRPSSPGDETLVVDANGIAVPPGEIGELLTRGPGVIDSYHAGVAAESFTAEGFYRTGDLVRSDSMGNFVVMGRVKDVINRGGEKVPADELEALAVQHPGIREVAAVSMPHVVLGEAVCLYVVPTGTTELSLRGIRQFLNDRGLAQFKLPERIVEMDALPRIGVGKVNKVALRADIVDRLSRESKLSTPRFV
ncbi:(2,3-dihydroxybenzoyl)adenylate synthase [Nocardia goodfellowii]